VAAGRGLGLGLYLVHATMSAMGGGVRIEQRQPAAIFALRWMRPGPEAHEGAEEGARLTPSV
jgi:signal transduction histidine kinase